MAIGDLVRICSLYVDGVEFGPSGYSSSSYAGAVISYSTATSDSKKRIMVEASLNGQTIYIDTNFWHKVVFIPAPPHTYHVR